MRNPRYLQQNDERQNEVLEMKDPLKDPVKDPVKKSEKEQENDEKSKLLACAECRSTDEQGENVSKDASQPKMFGLHLLKNWMFVMFLISASLSNLSMDSLHWFIPDRAIEIGFSKQHAALTLNSRERSKHLQSSFLWDFNLRQVLLSRHYVRSLQLTEWV